MSHPCFLVRRMVSDTIPEQMSGPVVVAHFDTYEEAEADRCDREQAARGVTNPFRLRQGRLASITSLESDILADWLVDAGVDPPTPDANGTRRWHLWWEARMPDVHACVWPALDRLRFFDVAERLSISRLVYLVQEIGWHQHDDWPATTGPETRRAVEAFTTRKSAEVRRDELERLNHAPYGAWDVFPHPGDYENRYEVVAIVLEEE